MYACMYYGVYLVFVYVCVVEAEQAREESCRCISGCETGHVDARGHRRHEPGDTGGPHGGRVDAFWRLNREYLSMF